MTPTQTGIAGISVATLGAVIVWVLGLWKIPAPPDVVVGFFATALIYAGHNLHNLVVALLASRGVKVQESKS